MCGDAISCDSSFAVACVFASVLKNNVDVCSSFISLFLLFEPRLFICVCFRLYPPICLHIPLNHLFLSSAVPRTITSRSHNRPDYCHKQAAGSYAQLRCDLRCTVAVTSTVAVGAAVARATAVVAAAAAADPAAAVAACCSHCVSVVVISGVFVFYFFVSRLQSSSSLFC